MKDLLMLLAHLLTTIARLLGSGGAKAVVADSLLMKQQLIIINRRIIGFGIHAGNVDGIALAECSTPLYHPSAHQNISALITIHSSCITNGGQT